MEEKSSSLPHPTRLGRVRQGQKKEAQAASTGG